MVIHVGEYEFRTNTPQLYWPNRVRYPPVVVRTNHIPPPPPIPILALLVGFTLSLLAFFFLP